MRFESEGPATLMEIVHPRLTSSEVSELKTWVFPSNSQACGTVLTFPRQSAFSLLDVNFEEQPVLLLSGILTVSTERETPFSPL